MASYVEAREFVHLNVGSGRNLVIFLRPHPKEIPPEGSEPLVPVREFSSPGNARKELDREVRELY